MPLSNGPVYTPALSVYTLKQTRLFMQQRQEAVERLAVIRTEAHADHRNTLLKEHDAKLSEAAVVGTLRIPLRDTLALCDICHKAPSAVASPGTLCTPCRKLTRTHYHSLCTTLHCAACVWIARYPHV